MARRSRGASNENSGGAGGGGKSISPEVSTATLVGDRRCALGGSTELGGVVRVKGVDPSAAQFQWFRYNQADGSQSVIEGATRHQYAPEPADVGGALSVTVHRPGTGTPPVSLRTSTLVTSPPAYGEYVARMISRGTLSLNVVIVQQCGRVLQERPLHKLEISFSKVKIRRDDKTRYKEAYNSEMRVCGARGGGDAAAQGLFLNLKGSMSFMIACENKKDRNCAIALIRKFALLQSVSLASNDC